MSTIAEIRRTLGVLFEPGEVFEVRIPSVPDAGTVAGRFDDLDDAAREVMRYDDRARGIYVTLQHLDHEEPDNVLREHVSRATADEHADRYRWLLIDLDAERAKDTNASAEEHDLALARGQEIARWLCDEFGISRNSIVLADSGNGAHVYVRIDHPASDKELVRVALLGLSARWDDERVHVDRTVHNPSRITKLAGTMTRKGEHTTERPQRRSRIVWAPKTIEVAPADLLERLAALAPEKPRREQRASGAYSNGHDPNVDASLSWYGVACAADGLVLRRLRDGKLAVRCPNEREHTTTSDSGTDCVVFPPAPGETLGKLHCSHSHCEGRTHAEWRAMLSPRAVAAADAAYPKLHPDERARRQEKGGDEEPASGGRRTRWRSTRADVLLHEPAGPESEWLAPYVRTHAINLLAGPKGAGKTWLALWVIREALLRGDAVLLVDNDNSRRQVVGKLRGLLADEPEALSRFHVVSEPDPTPTLLSDDGWVEILPPGHEDILLVIDSLNSALPVGGDDRPRSTAGMERLRRLLAGRVCTVLALDNATKDGSTVAGSPVKGDKTDVLIEARDITGVALDPEKGGWRAQIPSGGAAEWRGTASGDQHPDGTYTHDVALIASKDRTQDGGWARVMRVRLGRVADSPVTVLDVTDVTETYDRRYPSRTAAKGSVRVTAALDLAAELGRRGGSMREDSTCRLTERDDGYPGATAWLMRRCGIGRDLAREVIEGGGVPGDAPLWEVVAGTGRGAPATVRLLTGEAETSCAGDSPSLGNGNTRAERKTPRNSTTAGVSFARVGPAQNAHPRRSRAEAARVCEPRSTDPDAPRQGGPASGHGLPLRPLDRGWSVAAADGWERLEPGTVAARLPDLDRAAVERALGTGRVRLVGEDLDDPSGWVVEVPS